jgi:predicted AlkP superfamily pyrophosphatase or phosphodiesterase
MIVFQPRRLGVLLLGFLLALPAIGAAPRAVRSQPKLVVAIAVDQFADALYRIYRPTFTGGLARLGRGITFTGYQSHAATETCPGHSTILTGRHPAGTGIVSNNWLDRKTGEKVYCVAVPGGAAADRGPQNLRADTFGDWMKDADPRARVISVSGKDRAAIMLGGHRADAVYWWRDGTGFDTSASASSTAATISTVMKFNQALVDQWHVAPPDLWPSNIPSRCAALATPHRFGRVDLPGTMPPPTARSAEQAPDFAKQTAFANELHASPLFDSLTERLAENLIDDAKLGRGPATDLLAISFSATDYVGHRFGNGGAEMCVQMAALDATLGRLFARLDRLGIAYAVVLTADHGAIDAPERIKGHSVADRVDPAMLLGALNGDLRAKFGLTKDPIVAADGDPQTLNIVGGDGSLRDAAIAWLKARPEIVAVTPAATIAAIPMPRGRPDRLTLLQRYRESFDPERGADLYVEFGEYAARSMPKAPTDTVAGHGSPWNHDRQVPILFWWPGIRAQARRDAIETVDIAPTLAAIAGVGAPAVDGSCLRAIAAAYAPASLRRCGRIRPPREPRHNGVY